MSNTMRYAILFTQCMPLPYMGIQKEGRVNHLFKYDGIFATICTKLANLLILNFLTILCCLPIFTLGPALAALHYTANKIYHDEETGICAHYFHSFRENFRQGLILGLAALFCSILFLADILLLTTGILPFSEEGLRNVYLVIVGILALAAGSIFTWCFALLARYQNSIRQILHNAVFLTMNRPLRSLGLTLLSIFPVGLLFIHLQAGIVTATIGVSLSAFLQSRLYSKVFSTLEADSAALNT